MASPGRAGSSNYAEDNYLMQSMSVTRINHREASLDLVVVGDGPLWVGGGRERKGGRIVQS